MGAAASFFRRKKGPAPQEEVPEKVVEGNEEADVLQGTEDIICGIMRQHPPSKSGEKRWRDITRDINYALRKRRIEVGPLKELIAKHGGIQVPGGWQEEILEVKRKKQLREERLKKAKEEEEERLRKEEEERQAAKRTFLGRLHFRRRKGKNMPLKVAVSAGDIGVDAASGGGDDGDEGLTDGENDSETEGDGTLSSGEDGDAEEEAKQAKEDKRDGYEYIPLTKYEVFSYVRWLHVAAAKGLAKDEEVMKERDGLIGRLNDLFKDLPEDEAKAISQENRRKQGLRDVALAYGEIRIESLIWLFIKLRRIHGHLDAKGGSFWDLGSGVGKVVLAAALFHPFEACFGVEKLRDLRVTSSGVLKKYNRDVIPELPVAHSRTLVDFITGDAVEQAWPQDATCIFVHTNFNSKDMAEVKTKADGMQVGSLCISVTVQAVGDVKWGLLASEQVQTSWGPTTLYLHEKLLL